MEALIVVLLGVGTVGVWAWFANRDFDKFIAADEALDREFEQRLQASAEKQMRVSDLLAQKEGDLLSQMENEEEEKKVTVPSWAEALASGLGASDLVIFSGGHPTGSYQAKRSKSSDFEAEDTHGPWRVIKTSRDLSSVATAVRSNVERYFVFHEPIFPKDGALSGEVKSLPLPPKEKSAAKKPGKPRSTHIDR